MAAFTLAHLSDPHLPPMPAARFRDLASKRALGYLNWTRNRHKYHRREVLDALVADIRAQHPDHMTLALAAFGAHLGAGFARDRDSAIRGVVVVDEDFSRRQRLVKIGDDFCNRRLLVEARHQNGNPRLHWLGLREFPPRKLRERLRHTG